MPVFIYSLVFFA